MGPLTNVALAFSTDEEVPSLIRDIFIMGGNIEGVGNCTQEGFSACAEFNFGADPEAAYVVLNRADKFNGRLMNNRIRHRKWNYSECSFLEVISHTSVAIKLK